MNIPKELKYSNDHEWLRVEGEFAFVGITDFASQELGDIVFVEVETIGETLNKDEVFGSIEAVKTVSDLLMPVAGEVVELNSALEDSPETINADPYGKGWIAKINISDQAEVDELMDATAYSEFVKG